MNAEKYRIEPVRRIFWWPHPYADGLLWRRVVVGYRYWVDGAEVAFP